MTAFGHSIDFDYLTTQQTKASKQLPVLNFKAYTTSSVPYPHVIKYHQNQGRNVFLTTDRSFDENVDKQMWSFIVEDIVTFIWEKGSSIIYYDKSQNTNIILLEYWFLHTLLPIYFTVERKYEFIHTGGVEIDSQPVLFIAPSYGGKSTLTDYFIQQGHAMITDDRVGLYDTSQNIKCVSSYPYHRPYRKMEDLGQKVENFITEDTDLHVIYVLESVDANDEIRFTRLKGIDSFKVLRYNFDFTLPLNKARSFELIAKIASKVPIYKLSIPWDLDRLNEVYARICQHSKEGVKL